MRPGPTWLALAATLLALGAVGAESSRASGGQRLPVIRQVKPRKGLPAGGTKVELFGQPLENARAVYFGTVPGRIVEEECGGECEIAPYRWLLVESPPHPPGKVNVTFENGGGEVSAPDPRAEFTYKGAGHGPVVAGVSAPEIAETNAELNAEIDPNGLATTFAFWVTYEPCQNGAGRCAIQGPETELVAEGELPAGSGPVSADATMRGLRHGCGYAYWVVARNAAGEADSKQKTLKTRGQRGLGCLREEPLASADALAPIPASAFG